MVSDNVTEILLDAHIFAVRGVRSFGKPGS